MHSFRPSARAGLLAAAAVLVAMLVAVPSAGAATFSGGEIKLDFKQLKGVKITPKGHSAKTKTGATFSFADEAGSATLNAQASGNLLLSQASEVTITRGKKKIVLKSFVQKLKSGKGILAAKVGGKGKWIDLFDQASANRIVVDGKFTTLSLQTASMSLTKAGAAALNKAFGLKGKSSLKNKAKVGSASFRAERLLEFGSGQTRTAFDPGFYDSLKNNCDITLAATGTAQPIAPDETTAPRGGALLNVIGGTMNATTLAGNFQHDEGGTSLDRPAGSSKGPAYHTEIIRYEFDFAQNPPLTRAYSTAVVNTVPIGTLEGATVTADLTDTGGTVTVTGGVLRLSIPAGGLLQQQTGCEIPPNTALATVNLTANVK